MTRTLLERQREGVAAQIRWAVLHGGDQELLDLLRIESARLCVMIGQCPSQVSTAPSTSPRKIRGIEPVGATARRPSRPEARRRPRRRGWSRAKMAEGPTPAGPAQSAGAAAQPRQRWATNRPPVAEKTRSSDQKKTRSSDQRLRDAARSCGASSVASLYSSDAMGWQQTSC
jgi:hypothetical protein